MDSFNVSYSLNKLGPWSDPLLAGILGSASTVNFSDTLASALPVITNNPGAFVADHLLGQGVAQDTPAEKPPTESARVKEEILQGPLGSEVNPSLIGKIRQDAAADKDTDWNFVGKNVLVAIVGLLLLAFGLWILLYPTAKPYLIAGGKAAAKAAA